MYIINSYDLPNSRVRVLQLNGDKLELCTYPKRLVPESEECKYSDKFKLTRVGGDFQLGDFARGKILNNKVYYSYCNPKIRNILTKALGCSEGSSFRSI